MWGINLCKVYFIINKSGKLFSVCTKINVLVLKLGRLYDRTFKLPSFCYTRTLLLENILYNICGFCAIFRPENRKNSSGSTKKRLIKITGFHILLKSKKLYCPIAIHFKLGCNLKKALILEIVLQG